MDLKKISINTQSKIYNHTISYLLKEENFNELEKNDKNKIFSIKRKLNTNLQINLFLISSAYVLINITLIKKIKPIFFNRIFDFGCISGVSYLGAYYAYKKNINDNLKEINFLKTKYSLIIKNTISL